MDRRTWIQLITILTAARDARAQQRGGVATPPAEGGGGRGGGRGLSGFQNQPMRITKDEVVAGLNATEVDQTVQLILKIRDAGITILIVEHIMRVIMKISTRIIVLNYGRMIAHGKPEEVASNREVIEAYLGESVATADGSTP